MFGLIKNDKVAYGVMYFLDRKVIIVLIIAILISIGILKIEIEKYYKSNKLINILLNIYSIIILMLSYMSILASTYNPFIYFRF